VNSIAGIAHLLAAGDGRFKKWSGSGKNIGRFHRAETHGEVVIESVVGGKLDRIAVAAFGPETGIELTYLPGSSVPRLMISI
jgi:hypothetical protein